jgi:tight adherence protein B
MASFAVVALAVWLLAVGGWWMATRFFRKADAAKIRQRVIQAPAGPKPAGKKSKAGQVELITSEDRVTGRIVLALMERYRLMDRIQKLLEQAGVKWRPARLAHVSLALFLTGFIVGWQFVAGNRLLVNLAIGAFLGALPWLHVLRVRSKRLDVFEEQFPESLEFIARSMRAGHAFSASLEMIHKEFQEPLAGEFRRAFEEHNLGIPLDAALQKMGQRIPSLDVQFFISAVLLQKRTGGNLAEILDKLAYIIRERFKLRGKIRAISAHGRMTGAALSLIPVFVAVMMFWVNPGYVQFFFEDEIGHYMAGGAIGLQLIGYAIIQKIVSIEV